MQVYTPPAGLRAPKKNNGNPDSMFSMTFYICFSPVASLCNFYYILARFEHACWVKFSISFLTCCTPFSNMDVVFSWYRFCNLLYSFIVHFKVPKTCKFMLPSERELDLPFYSLYKKKHCFFLDFGFDFSIILYVFGVIFQYFFGI